MDEFCGAMAEMARGVTVEDLRLAAEVVTGRRALVVQAPSVAVGPRMEEARLEEVVERALRNWIGITHSEACIARRWRAMPAVIEQRDADYEDALQAYREVVGREPTASSKEE